MPELLQDVMQSGIKRWEKMSPEERASASRKKAEENPLPLRVAIEPTPERGGGIMKSEMIIGRGLWTWGMRHLLTHRLDIPLQHRWTILKPADGFTWITTDDPAIRLSYSDDSNYHFKGGWGQDGCDLILPLGPHHLLFTQVGHRVPQRGSHMSVERTRILTRLMAEHAHRDIFAAQPVDIIETIRPRTINQATVESEAQQWKDWPGQQSAGERELVAPPADSE